MGAAAVAIANPMIAKIGIGWTGTFRDFLRILFNSMFWAVEIWGPEWRAEADATAR